MKKIKIQILGMGCPQCKTLAKNAEQAAKDLGLEYEIEMSLRLNEINRFGLVMNIPALLINGKVEITGKVASVEEIKQLILGKMPVLG